MTRPGRYRRSGADPPFGDPRRGHGVAMEGYFWRFTDVRHGRVVVALCGVNRAPDGAWANVALAVHPGGVVHETALEGAWADPDGFGVHAGEGAFAADEARLRVDLGPRARLDVQLADEAPWPRRAFGGLGVAHAVPGLSQYWHPHLLGARAAGRATIGGEAVDLDGAAVYAEKNWGRGGFPERWWWGQAQGFARDDVCVAFAGGAVGLGPARMQATAIAVRLGDELVRVGDPLLAPVRARVAPGRWALRGRGPRWSVELEAEAPPSDVVALPVPVPAERRTVDAAHQHLAGRLRVVVRRRGRVAFAGASALAGLEQGDLSERGGR